MLRILLGLFLLIGMARGGEPLHQQILEISKEAHGKVSVAMSLPGLVLGGDVDPQARPPMQSVFKLPLAVTILHQVEQGKFALDQPILFSPGDRILPHAYSPLQDKFPQGGVQVPLRDLLQATASLSDNVAADILMRLAGGPNAVNDYMASLEVRGLHLVDDEHALHRDESRQYRNWFEPTAAVQFLRRIADHSPLNAEDTQLLLGWLRASPMTTRLAGDLPPGTSVAHKSGTSDVRNGVAAATNDIGLISLPDGKELAVAVFVTDSTASAEVRDQVIARIARAAYDAAIVAQSHSR